MRAGTMKKRVSVQTLSEAADSFGQMVESWTTAGTYWAEVTFTGGAEATNADQLKATVTHRVRMRRFGPLSPSSRLLLEGRVLAIISVNDVAEQRREYVLNCQEIAVPAPTP